MTTKPFEQQIRILTGDDELDTAIAGFSTEQHTVLIDYPDEFSNEFTCRVHKYGRIPDLREPDCSFVGCFEVGELESLIPLLISSRDKINEVSQNWDRNALSEMIIGQRIKGLRLITPAEMKRENWENWNTGEACVVIELENGTQIFRAAIPRATGLDASTASVRKDHLSM